MFTIPLTAIRVLAAHWPALLAWFLAGYLGRYVAIELAGWVGGHTATGGLLLLPLAILARLVSMVAMFLVVRGALRNLQQLAPLPEERRERRRTFVDATLASILPFFAVYAAWGLLREDFTEYLERALEVNQGVLVESILTGEDTSSREIADSVSFNAVTIAIVVVAFGLRWAWKRWGSRLPKALALVAVYLEAVWVFFALVLISEAIGRVQSFVDRRVAMVWLADLRQWIADRLAPVGWVWDGVQWFLGEAGGVLLLPLAWLVVAGVIYGQAIAPERLRIEHRAIETAKEGWARIPGALRRRLSDLGLEMVSRFRPIGRAVLLMWRAGPVLIATYVLLYTVLLAAESLLRVGLIRAIGPQDLFAFWRVADALIFSLIPLIIEPVRVALIAGSYDATLGELRRRRRGSGSGESADAAEADAAEAPVQESVSNRRYSGSTPPGDTSIQNGPSASDGITNPT